MTVVLVTGGARGIGRGTVDAAVARGWTAVAADLSHDGDLPDGAEFVECDAGDPASIAAACGEVVRRHGRLDGVHANAGIADWEPFLDMTPETYRRTMAVNLDGMFHTCQCAARVMADQGGGALVLTSSVRSVATNPLHAAYTTSKGGTNGLVLALATELGPMNIRVNGVLPGAIETPMNQAAVDLFFDGDAQALVDGFVPHVPLGRLGRSREVGEVVAFLLSDAASYVHGSLVRVDGGLLTTLT